MPIIVQISRDLRHSNGGKSPRKRYIPEQLCISLTRKNETHSLYVIYVFEIPFGQIYRREVFDNVICFPWIIHETVDTDENSLVYKLIVSLCLCLTYTILFGRTSYMISAITVSNIVGELNNWFILSIVGLIAMQIMLSRLTKLHSSQICFANFPTVNAQPPRSLCIDKHVCKRFALFSFVFV